MKQVISAESLGKHTVAVIDTCTGELSSLRYCGTERLLTPISWKFPIFEPVPKGEIIVAREQGSERRAITTPEMLSETGFKTQSESPRHAILRTEHPADPQGWPYHFACEITYIISANELTTKIRAWNKSPESMPHSIGLNINLRGNLKDISTFTNDHQSIDIHEPLTEPRIGGFGRVELHGIDAYVKADRARRKGLPFAVQRISPAEGGVEVLLASHQHQPQNFTRLHDDAGGRIRLRGPVEYEASVYFR